MIAPTSGSRGVRVQTERRTSLLTVRSSVLTGKRWRHPLRSSGDTTSSPRQCRATSQRTCSTGSPPRDTATHKCSRAITTTTSRTKTSRALIPRSARTLRPVTGEVARLPTGKARPIITAPEGCRDRPLSASLKEWGLSSGGWWVVAVAGVGGAGPGRRPGRAEVEELGGLVCGPRRRRGFVSSWFPQRGGMCERGRLGCQGISSCRLRAHDGIDGRDHQGLNHLDDPHPEVGSCR